MTTKPDYIAVKFFGPSNVKGSRYKVVDVRLNTTRWDEVENTFFDASGQYEAQGYSYLFEHNGWTYFSLVEGK